MSHVALSHVDDSFHVVFNTIEDYCPGFKKLVVGKEVLTPPDLERVFGLTGGVSTCTALTVSVHDNRY